MHQHPNSVLQPEPMTWVVCPGCKGEYGKLFDSGLCWDCDIALEVKEAKKMAKIRKIKEVLGENSKSYLEFRFEKFKETADNREALNACKSFDCLKHNLYLWGSCGTGKTHIATAAWKTCLERGYSGAIYSPPQLSRFMRTKDPDMEAERIKQIASCNVLLFDDLGLRELSEAMYSWYYEIISLRADNYRNGLIITSNLSLDDFARKINDDRLPSRIAGLCRQIKIEGKDWRLKKDERK